MLGTIFHTVRHLRPVQVYRRLYRPRPSVRVRPDAWPRTLSGVWQCSIERDSAQIGPRRFRFLNQEHEMVGWDDPALPRLWLYNLHYFDSPEAYLIARWINENPVGVGPGWEPYPLSLRISNWIKWALNGNPLSAAVLDSLAVQAEYLNRTVEYHLLANHLFVNAKALALAGMFFTGGAAARWLNRALAILNRECSEQILDDGGHFERSPMYHALILEDVLDLINAAHAFPGVCSDAAAHWGRMAPRMLGWLLNMTHPDGRIAFFNDAAFGVSPEVRQLLTYARSLNIQPEPVALSTAGYIRLENEHCVALFDAAPIGPDYQPGHAHADTLSFELSLSGRRVLVNSGTSTYDAGRQRLAERATAAHNTVRIDGLDSSEVWSSFRVARRARPFDFRTDRRSFVEAAHDGYRRLRDPVIHRRRLELEGGRLVITDDIQAAGDHKVEVFFHLHPDALADIALDSKFSRTVEATTWHPEFNVSLPNQTIVGTWEGRCPLRFTTIVQL